MKPFKIFARMYDFGTLQCREDGPRESLYFCIILFASDIIFAIATDMISNDLLEILCCPETKENVTLIDSSLIDKINQRITAGGIKNRAGQPVSEKIDGGLLRKDGKYLYPIREDIPIMLIDEALPMEQFV